jgi:tripartite-type tricarboxylate transporter receptor subunit TctC
VNKFVRLAAVTVAAIGISAGAALAAGADNYPSRPVKWIVPYPPGGTTDTLARIAAQWLSEKMGQQFIIENKPGGGNNIGTEYVIHSDPDGYTMLLVNPANGINTTLYKNLKFNFPKDIQGVAGLVRTPNVMVVNKDFPAKTVQEFIDYCKKNPGKINMASHLGASLWRTVQEDDRLRHAARPL